MIKQLLFSVIDLIFPNICAGCDKEAIQAPSIFCIDCAASLPYTNMELDAKNAFEQHFAGRLHIEAGTALFYLTKGGMIQKAIYAMKYGNQPQVGYYLGRMLGRKLKNHPVYKTCDMVVGIPLHKKKKWKRGYNQSDYIARGVAEILNIPFSKHAITRIRMTPSQTKKSRMLRMKNMREGFTVEQSDSIRNKHVLLVDDVLTSGATLDYCGHATLKEENVKLSLATLAMGSMV